MQNQLDQILAELARIFHYPLVKLGEAELTLASLVKFLCLIALVFIAERLLRQSLLRRVLQRTHLQASMQYAIGKIVGYCFILLGFYVALKLVGIDLTSLAVIAGAIGVGLGFGLQNIVNNFVSGVIILAERPISIGDRVVVGDVAGQVTKINLRSTNIITNDNITIIVPNSEFISSKVTNWSHGDPRVRIRLPLGVAYGSDTDKLRRVLVEMAKQHPKVLAEPPPDLFFVGFGDSSLDFELAVWTAEMTSKPRRFRSDLYYAIEKTLRENDIEIPFPQRDLHLRSGHFLLRGEPSETSAPEENGEGR